VHSPQVACVGAVLVGIADDCCIERRRIRQLRERGQCDARAALFANAAASTTRSARPNWFSSA